MYFSLLVSVLFLLSAYEKTMESTIIPPRIDIIACLLCVCVYIFFLWIIRQKNDTFFSNTNNFDRPKPNSVSNIERLLSITEFTNHHHWVKLNT